ncbi:hypothetical protein Zmor_006296 [Zophobas morio]|uniref:Uncharacterized protein n=1 Tax=Zophobas morio TaxID=2755281 RepID=A0AA38IUK7_9CUCU|nr:hypothetical protein Zmor_006296 [Zophobas morio]
MFRTELSGSDSYKAKKSNVLYKENISKFLKEAHDEHFLMAKVALITGIAGACRKSELTFLCFEDVLENHVWAFLYSNTPVGDDESAVISARYPQGTGADYEFISCHCLFLILIVVIRNVFSVTVIFNEAV